LACQRTAIGATVEPGRGRIGHSDNQRADQKSRENDPERCHVTPDSFHHRIPPVDVGDGTSIRTPQVSENPRRESGNSSIYGLRQKLPRTARALDAADATSDARTCQPTIAVNSGRRLRSEQLESPRVIE